VADAIHFLLFTPTIEVDIILWPCYVKLLFGLLGIIYRLIPAVNTQAGNESGILAR